MLIRHHQDTERKKENREKAVPEKKGQQKRILDNSLIHNMLKKPNHDVK